jgi:hypothetical protein
MEWFLQQNLRILEIARVSEVEIVLTPESHPCRIRGCAPHKQKIATVAAPQARQSGPPRRVSDQGHAPTANRENPTQPTTAQTPKAAHVTPNRTVGSIATSAGSHQGYPPSCHHASAFPTHDNVPGISPVANKQQQAASRMTFRKCGPRRPRKGFFKALSFVVAATTNRRRWLAQVPQVAANRWMPSSAWPQIDGCRRGATASDTRHFEATTPVNSVNL